MNSLASGVLSGGVLLYWGYIYICRKSGGTDSGKIEDESRRVLVAHGVMQENIYTDCLKAVHQARKKWHLLLQRVRSGDVIMIPRLDMVGEDYDAIIRNWQFLTKEKRADVVLLDFPALDTRGCHDLLGRFQTDTMLSAVVFSKMQERAVRRARQMRVINEAQQRGVRFGRPLHQLPDNFYEQVARFQAKKATLRECAAACGMAPTTFFRRMKQLENSQ